MAELELTRSRDDRRVYEVDGVGALRVGGLFSRSATAEAGGSSWTFDRRGFWSRTIEASDAAGAVVGSFDPRSIRRGGTLRWGGREFALQPASNWRERYALLDGKGWGKRPVSISVNEPDAVEPGLVLFAAYVVRRLAEDAASTVTAGTSGATA